MSALKKQGFRVLFHTLIVFCLSCPILAADGLYTVMSDDGVALKMRRYRPSEEAPFRDGRQPVVLYSGILTNMNEFLTHTPEERKAAYAGMTLPEPVADWAKNDPYIAADPMRYYSIAHYLWVRGYDPWLVNYRGTGRGEFKSGRGSLMNTLDIWGIMDTAPCIAKVREVTGIDPFIGGHSTGGFACHAYLQGATFDPAELKAGYENGYLPHVKATPLLAAARNAAIKGYIAIDPGLTPWLPEIIDQTFMWALFGQPGYLDLDTLMEDVVNPAITSKGLMPATIELVCGTIQELNAEYGQYLSLIPYLDIWYTSDTVPNTEDFFARYCASSTFIRQLGHWGDIGLHRSIREFWKNGIENKDLLKGPEPDPGNDGYYYYDSHMNLISVPTIAVLSESDGLVRANDVIEFLMQAKTPHPDDRYRIISGTAHADIPMGITAPTITFPLIGEWLDTQMARTAAADAVPSSADAQSQKSKDQESSGGSGGGTCFIATVLAI